MENLVNTIFPQKCVFCGSLGDIFCENCLSNCSILLEQRCLICDKPSEVGETHRFCKEKYLNRHVLKDSSDSKLVSCPSQLISSFVYEQNVRECIRKSKYSSRLFMCLKRLSFEGVNLVHEWGFNFKDFTVVSIPVSKQKEKVRGFNHVDIISRVFARKFGLYVDNSILSRIKDKQAQHDLSRKDRFENIKGSFASNRCAAGKKIILIDDICTTGATFLESSKVLYEHGALDVRCFSLSKKL